MTACNRYSTVAPRQIDFRFSMAPRNAFENAGNPLPDTHRESILMRKFPLILAVLLAVASCFGLSGVAAAAPSSHTAPVGLTCTGSETVDYRPGLLLTPRKVDVEVRGDLSHCTSSDHDLTAGKYGEDFHAELSCSTLLAGREGTRVFRWNNGHTSTFKFTRAINDVGGQTTVTFTGTITSGQFDGAHAVEQAVIPTLSTAKCLAHPGLTRLGPGTVLLTITKP